MHLIPQDYLLGATALVLEVLVCACAFRRRLYLRLPFFTIYLALVLARTLFGWLVYSAWGYESRIAFYFFWVSQAMLVAARAAAIAEIAWRALRDYRGIWALAWRLLCGIALLLLVNAALDAHASKSRIATFVLSAERGLELAAAVVLLTLLFVSGYYGIRLEPVQRMVALGLGFYSTIQVLNNSIASEWLSQFFHWWASIRMISFQVALLIWWWALRKPLPAVTAAPVLLSQNVYDELTPQINHRLRLLNQRLLEILK